MPDEKKEKMDWDRIFLNPMIPKLWANGIVIGRSSAEATILFLQGKAGVTSISMGYPTLKSIHQAIGHIIEEVEKATGEKIKDNQELLQYFASKETDATSSDI